MKIKRLTLENFRQYFGRQSIEFASYDQRKVTIIHGVNGAGKTSIFTALNWGLYGEGVDDLSTLISKEAREQAQPGERVTTSVEIVFTHDTYRYLVRRSVSGIKQLEGHLKMWPETEFLMQQIDPTGQATKVNSPVTTMNAILPANVRTYFLFDGEKIDDFAKPEAAREVKDAVYLVLRLEILERARKHLETQAKNYRGDLAKNADQALRELLKKTEEARKEREEYETRLKELDSERESAQRKISEINNALRGMQGVGQLQEQREASEHELARLHEDLKRVTGEIQGLATASAFVVGKSALDEALNVLDEKRRRGEIPSNVRQQFVLDLLEQAVCICGRPFSEHGPEESRLRQLLQTSVSGSLEDEVLSLTATLRGMEQRVADHLATLSRLMHQRAELLDRIRTEDSILGDLELQLRDSPVEQVADLERQRVKFQADIDSYLMESGSLKERVARVTEEIEELDKAISKVEKAAKKSKRLSRKLDLVQQAIKAIDNTYQAFADAMRQQIESKTKEIFKKLIWKESHFQDVQLGADYDLKVIDRYGQQARPDLSAGERQVLSLSFITAMSRVSEEEAPLVMDTPFGRLSSHHRNSITEHLPQLADQLILFVTDEELRDQARQNLEAYIGAEYRLHFDGATSQTQIEEVR